MALTNQLRSSLLQNIGVRRVLQELLSIQASLVLIWPLIMSLPFSWSPAYRSSSFFLLYFLLSILWSVLRWQKKPATRPWWKHIPCEIAFAGALGLELIISLNIVAFIFGSLSALAFLRQREGPFVLSNVYPLGLSSGAAFFLLHIGIPLWIQWNRLRRTRLRWALTHAHLLVVVIGAAAISALLLFFWGLDNSGPNTGFPRGVSPLFILLMMFIITAVVLTFVLPPSALFSYIFARQTTRRIDKLTLVASALRNGRYNERVVVEGKDEIARLQTDFNAMAADLEQTMRELQEERDNVARLLQARRELIASVSHELRTPVATVRSYLESTLSSWDQQPPVTLQQDLQVMEQQTIRLQALINDLFTLARAEVGQLEMRCAPTDIELLVSRVVETMAPIAWRGSKIEVVADIAPIQPQFPLALVDESRLEQVLQNLLHNAVQHTPPGGIIVLSAFVEADSIVLQVKDTGEGIATEELVRIWERFYRAENAHNKPGTGLGLAIVKELTEAMGGSVEVSSVPGQGTCFTLYLPRE